MDFNINLQIGQGLYYSKNKNKPEITLTWRYLSFVRGHGL